MKTYSTKAAAKKGAKRQELNLKELTFVENTDGRWSWVEKLETISPLGVSSEYAVIGTFTHCPHCETHLSNGYCDNADTYAELKAGTMITSNTAESIREMELHVTAEFCCLACCEDFGLPLSLSAKVGLKIEKDRPEQNGIIRPSVGGKCRAIWDACDEFLADNQRSPMPKDIKAKAEVEGWNHNNAVIELYQWRKFNNVKKG